jgi:selenium metabolism protein YedF
MKTIDTKGQKCPLPLMAAKKALKEIAAGEAFIVLTDNQTSFNNLSKFLKDNKTDFSVETDEGVWKLTIVKKEEEVAQAKEGTYSNSSVPDFQKGNFVIAISSDKMGEGNDGLGYLLMKNFINSVKDLDILPEKIVLYNKGVTLVSTDSPVAKHLSDLEKMGVKILVCGTCVQHYSLEGRTGAGIVSNMFEITDAMASAGNIVRP